MDRKANVIASKIARDKNRHREIVFIAVRQRLIEARKALHLFIISRCI